MNMVEILLAITIVGGTAGMLVRQAEVEADAETAREVVRQIDAIASAAVAAQRDAPHDRVSGWFPQTTTAESDVPAEGLLLSGDAARRVTSRLDGALVNPATGALGANAASARDYQLRWIVPPDLPPLVAGDPPRRFPGRMVVTTRIVGPNMAARVVDALAGRVVESIPAIGANDPEDTEYLIRVAVPESARSMLASTNAKSLGANFRFERGAGSTRNSEFEEERIGSRLIFANDLHVPAALANPGTGNAYQMGPGVACSGNAFAIASDGSFVSCRQGEDDATGVRTWQRASATSNPSTGIPKGLKPRQCSPDRKWNSAGTQCVCKLPLVPIPGSTRCGREPSTTDPIPLATELEVCPDDYETVFYADSTTTADARSHYAANADGTVSRKPGSTGFMCRKPFKCPAGTRAVPNGCAVLTPADHLPTVTHGSGGGMNRIGHAVCHNRCPTPGPGTVCHYCPIRENGGYGELSKELQCGLKIGHYDLCGAPWSTMVVASSAAFTTKQIAHDSADVGWTESTLSRNAKWNLLTFPPTSQTNELTCDPFPLLTGDVRLAGIPALLATSPTRPSRCAYHAMKSSGTATPRLTSYSSTATPPVKVGMPARTICGTEQAGTDKFGSGDCWTPPIQVPKTGFTGFGVPVIEADGPGVSDDRGEPYLGGHWDENGRFNINRWVEKNIKPAPGAPWSTPTDSDYKTLCEKYTGHCNEIAVHASARMVCRVERIPVPVEDEDGNHLLDQFNDPLYDWVCPEQEVLEYFYDLPSELHGRPGGGPSTVVKYATLAGASGSTMAIDFGSAVAATTRVTPDTKPLSSQELGSRTTPLPGYATVKCKVGVPSRDRNECVIERDVCSTTENELGDAITAEEKAWVCDSRPKGQLATNCDAQNVAKKGEDGTHERRVSTGCMATEAVASATTDVPAVIYHGLPVRQQL